MNPNGKRSVWIAELLLGVIGMSALFVGATEITGWTVLAIAGVAGVDRFIK